MIDNFCQPIPGGVFELWLAHVEGEGLHEFSVVFLFGMGQENEEEKDSYLVHDIIYIVDIQLYFGIVVD
jgi:hypothetical protein